MGFWKIILLFVFIYFQSFLLIPFKNPSKNLQIIEENGVSLHHEETPFLNQNYNCLLANMGAKILLFSQSTKSMNNKLI